MIKFLELFEIPGDFCAKSGPLFAKKWHLINPGGGNPNKSAAFAVLPWDFLIR